MHLCSCRNVATYPISEPSADCIADGISGVWKFREDTNADNFYEIYPRDPVSKKHYHVRFWDRGGSNPTYEGNIFFSRIGGSLFINVPYFEHDMQTDNYFANKGYMFLKIESADVLFKEMVISVVNDTTMRSLKSSSEVRAYLTKNLDNGSIYQPVKHFYKVLEPPVLLMRGGLGH
jgi:hypothetical protein